MYEGIYFPKKSSNKWCAVGIKCMTQGRQYKLLKSGRASSNVECRRYPAAACISPKCDSKISIILILKVIFPRILIEAWTASVATSEA